MKTARKGSGTDDVAQSSTYDKIKFSIDLIEACRRELDFLVDVDQHQALLTPGPTVRRAIRRYEQCWLPLASGHRSQTLCPALDVHWVWHCHMLAPYSYEKDVKNLVGCVIDHRVMSRTELETARKKTKSLWTAAYPHEPFDVDLSSATDGADTTTDDYKSQCSYNLEAAIERQSKFYYQVCVVLSRRHRIKASLC